MTSTSVGTVLFNTDSIVRPSFRHFLTGVCDAFCLSGDTRRKFHFAGSPEEADAAAVTNDWWAVREDFHSAVSAVVPFECDAADSRCLL